MVFYYEVTLEDMGSSTDKSKITIGFSDKDFVLEQQVGSCYK